MNSFNQSHQSSTFRYNPNSNKMNHLDDNDNDDDVEFSGFLDIYVHHAKNIHNICIYDNQDVYAKFSLTYNPDETLSTRIINKGGKNPIFNQNLRVKIVQIDAVLKCEIWMFSRSRNHLEDQLLGFALVPISEVFGKGKVTEDYSLSSTDLFHSPAGTVQLTLSLDTSFPINSTLSSKPQSGTNSSISSEVVLLDPIEYSRIEFPDINVANENQKMVCEYFNLESYGSISRPNSIGSLPFLQLSGSHQDVDCEMTMNSSGENHESISRLSSSTTTSLSDDRNTNGSVVIKSNLRGDLSNSFNVLVSVESNQNSCVSPDTPTSKKESETRDENKELKFSTKENETNIDRNIEATKFGQVYSVPPQNIDMEAEQSSMQKQIVDMYMRSMHQFTESLAKMKLPMDLDHKHDNQNQGDVIQNHKDNKLETDKKKNDGSRVFYGSRAFF
ncbi:putative C2 domain-containing protein [Medicago truncatula]|uniref:Putative C2 domain-containing protein n=1 Tax=Medicago truncatula TaxID=3880 RepID=A0A396IPR0_MEDTR|nr:putative C2 domain-containing protein [Medicago truncatula]